MSTWILRCAQDDGSRKLMSVRTFPGDSDAGKWFDGIVAGFVAPAGQAHVGADMNTLIRNFHSLSPRALLAVVALAAFLPLFSGCTTTTPGPGGVGVVAYGHGELSTDV